MKAFRIRSEGVAGFEDLAIDELDPGEVVVRVAYSDVNY